MTKSASRRPHQTASGMSPSKEGYRIRIALRTPDAPPVSQPVKRSVAVALDIIRDIKDRQLKPGDQLPLESEMLVLYKVSRSSLREALRLLEAQGLICIRTGPRGGTTVGRPSPFYLARTVVPYLHMAGATCGQALETWAMTETLLVRAAALNPDRETVKAVMRPFAKAPPQGVVRGMDVGVDFHDAVAMVSGNPVLDLMLRSVAHVVSDYILNAMPVAPKLTEWMEQDHAALAQAIIDGDADKAAEIATIHSHRVIDELSRFAPNRLSEQVKWL